MPEKAQPPTPRLRRGPPRKRGGGQALVEFAVTLPILVLLVAGVLELGRGDTIAVATSNAAREGARYVAGKTSTTNGPGLANMCSLVKADLAATTTNVICPTQVNHAPPFVAGTDYTAPVAGQAVVAIYCGAGSNCTGSVTTLAGTEVDASVYYGVSDLNLLGGGITISGSSRSTTSW